MFGGGMSERTIAQLCDEKWNPNLLLYCDQTKSGIPFRTQFKIAGHGAAEVRHRRQLLVPEPARLSLRHGGAQHRHRHRRRPERPAGRVVAGQPERPGHGVADHADDDATRLPGNSVRAQGSAGRRSWSIPGMTVASLSVPLVAPQTEFGDRINQLDLNVAKTFRMRPRQLPAEDRLLQPAEPVPGLRRPQPQLRHDGVQAAAVDSGRPRVPAWSDREVLIWRP